MSKLSKLERFLQTDPRDVGCAELFEVVVIYTEMVLAGVDPEIRYPGAAAHLRSCQPCADDFEGLLTVAGSIDL